MSVVRYREFDPKKHGRSRVTNGKAPLGLNWRSSEARRFRDVIELLLNELSTNGKALSTSQMSLVRQAALIIVQCEQMQLASCNGEEIDGDVLVRLGNLSLRILDRLERQIKAKGKGESITATSMIADHFATKRKAAP